MEKKKVIVLCVAVAVTACVVTALFTYNYVNAQERGNEILLGSGNYEDIAKYMEISDLERIIDENYYRPVEDGELVDGAMKGMVDSLNDPYSVYYTDEEYKQYAESNEGFSVGVGMAFEPYTKDTGYLKVVRVYKETPADLAGVAVDDVVIAVNGVNIRDMDFDGAIGLINGPSGSEVTLTVSTNGEARDVRLTRADEPIPPVFFTMLDDRIGQIIISEFSGDCVEEFRSSLENLKDVQEAEGVVIDLRGNMGGNVKDAIDILDQIMPQGLLAYSVDKNGEKTEWSADDKYDDFPIAVVVNGGTASASEIFAGAIQDGQRGKVIGTQTYGKGVMQTVVSMPYSGGGVKLTTATYFTPSGKEININGITPDEVVEESVGVTTPEADAQLQAAKAAIYDQIGGV